MTYVIGIDPGLKGGWAALSSHTMVAHASPFRLAGKELDLEGLAFDLAVYRDNAVAVVEKVGAMPGQGVTSMFTFGKGYGSILGVLAALKVRTELVTPQAWKAVVLAGVDKDKDGAVAYCRRAFPGVTLIPAGCKKPHDGMADALCLAEYGRRTYLTKEASPCS